MNNKPAHTKLFSQIIELLQSARNQVVRTVNRAMVATYFEIGRILVEEEQKGNERAEYGKELLTSLSNTLTKEFGKGFSVTNLRQMRGFYLVYQKQQTLSAELKRGKRQTVSDEFKLTKNTVPDFSLSWSHYLKLIRIDDKQERGFYEIGRSKLDGS